MKGAVGFLVGIVGLCLFGSVSILIPMTMRQSEGFVLFMLLLAVAFVFLNVLVVGLYRMLVHLHEIVLYPDDPFYHSQRGKPLFFIGYVGLLVALVFVIFLALLDNVFRIHIGGRQLQTILTLNWFVGWVFFGFFLGGVLAMLSDIYQKAFFRSTTYSPEADTDEDFNIARSGSGRGPRRPGENRLGEDRLSDNRDERRPSWDEP